MFYKSQGEPVLMASKNQSYALLCGIHGGRTLDCLSDDLFLAGLRWQLACVGMHCFAAAALFPTNVLNN